MSTTAGEATESQSRPRKAGLFDIRTFIAMLLGFDGVVILLVGIFGTSQSAVDKAAGINVNLWVGMGLIVAAVVFETWKRLNPVKVDESQIDRGDDDRPSH